MKRVLVAPLDWGLGHATRCIPIISTLLQWPCEVLIAGSGDSLALLQKEFPALQSFALPAYQPEYPRGGSMVFKMMQQLPHFIRVIKQEHIALEKMISEHKVDLVISDNRYGCWSKQISSVFITHQSNILMPRRFGWLASRVRKINHRMMKRFTVCWIPDVPGDESIAGSLLEFGDMDKSIPQKYIGPLSRFSARTQRTIQYDLLCIFSGPEPQRSIFEQIVINQLEKINLRVCIVRGLPQGNHQPLRTNAEVIDFMDGTMLQQTIEHSAIVLARSGFSTVMDLTTLGGQAVLVPTPGQTEQEYLATKIQEKGIVYTVGQEQFNLSLALQQVQNYTGFVAQSHNRHRLIQALQEILA